MQGWHGPTHLMCILAVLAASTPRLECICGQPTSRPSAVEVRLVIGQPAETCTCAGCRSGERSCCGGCPTNDKTAPIEKCRKDLQLRHVLALPHAANVSIPLLGATLEYLPVLAACLDRNSVRLEAGATLRCDIHHSPL